MNQKRERFKILEIRPRFNWGQTVMCYLIFLIYLILKIGLNLLIFHSWPTRYAWPNGLHTGHVISWLRSGSSPANSIFSSVLSKIMTWMNWLLIELALGPIFPFWPKYSPRIPSKNYACTKSKLSNPPILWLYVDH